ncbi:MAG: AMP-binding protein, partial [Planctomycetota bacterium]|nr:AMP-binding protein [Planctomycetota bacterium]
MSEQVYNPSEVLADRAHISSMQDYQDLYQQSIEDPEQFWDQQASRLTFFHPYDQVMSEDFYQGAVSWFENAKLNVSFNCIDRHLPEHADRTAIIWAKDEAGEYEHISYQTLHDEVCRLANVLKQHGVGKGDRVCFYMPMIPELAYGMLACARIGAVHSVVFAGFSAEALRERIVDADCRIVLTANEGLRGGKTIPLKATVDQAVENTNVATVLVSRRTATEVPMTAGRDFDLSTEMARQRPMCPAEWIDAEDPLFILYTSGSTGQPKGLQHTTAGYLLYAALTHETIFDYHAGDIYCCAADIGWITGHTY